VLRTEYVPTDEPKLRNEVRNQLWKISNLWRSSRPANART